MDHQEWHERRLRGFCRMLAATLDSPDEVRLSIEALARRIDAGRMDTADSRSALQQLDELLMDEISGRHR